MGAGPSRKLMDDPFPMDPKVTRDLNKLSSVVTRILSTPDIYDLANLTKSGTCGEYAVFLKSKITQQLLPFVARMSDGAVSEVLYQNPKKAIDKEADREAICSQLTNSMLRLVATVVACLGSIQIARSSGAPVIQQRGGAVTDVINWLVNAGYIAAAEVGAMTAGKKLQIMNRYGRAGMPTFYITFGEGRDGLYNATLTAVGTTDRPMPTGGLRVQFTNPIPVPGKTESILPIRVTDTAGVPWMVGILCRDLFESLNSASSRGGGGMPPGDIWEQIFLRASGSDDAARGAPAYYESHDQLAAANEIFNQYRRSKDSRVILQAVERYLIDVLAYIPPTSYGDAGVAPPMAVDIYGRPIPGGYVLPGAAGYAAGAIRPVAPIGAAGGIVPRYPMAHAPAAGPVRFGAPIGAARPISLIAPAEGSGLKYDIPLAAGKYITETLAAFRNAVPTLASPAAVRAHTLMARLNADRTVQTGICQDPYWSQPNLSRIYPWLTLQFLCVENWKALTADKRDISGVMFNDWGKFLNDMLNLYNDAALGPRLTTNTGFLGTIKFEGAATIELCKDPSKQRIERIDLIQAGLVELHNIYDGHVRKMWEILNSLIVVVQSPDTGAELVRLHPSVFKSGKASGEYIKEKADIARIEIAKFYLMIEASYLKTIKAIA
jgi:hypothetical protein